MKKLALLFSILFSVSLTAQVYVIEDQVTVNTCSGTFVDSGGEAATYSGNQSFTYTICPENAGQLVQLEFTAFATQTGADIMTIYNAADTLDPATSLGDFSGDAAADSPQTVIATVDNTSGCLTIVFTSDAGGNFDGWAANISCFEPCQEITAVLESSDPSPNAEGEIVICVGGTVDFEGSGVFSIDPTGATYSWSFGNDTNADGTNVTATYDTPGIYVVDLVVMDDNPIGCSNLNSISQVVRVAPEIEFTGTQAAQTQICYGESTTIEGVATIPQFDDCAPEIFDETWLEDTQSTGLGTSYSSTITVDCYGAGQLLTDVSQILDFCVNIEHSFIGDLDIYLIAPNGAEVYFLQYGDGVDPGTSLGIPDEADNGNPGTGWDYCFSPTATQSMNDVTGVNTIPEGTYAPLATSSFDNLLGTPLNGNWTFVVVDSWAFDDGTLFSWNLNFDPDIFPPSNIIVSETWDADSTIINTTDTTITVQPPTEGPFCYTFRAVDDFGCEYSTEVCVEVLPEFIYAAPNDLFVCNTGTTLGVFNLTENDAIISAPTPDPGDFEITYHESQVDADADSNPITPTDAASYSGTDGQIIYVRFEYKTSGCFETISFTLNLLDQPLISAVTDMVECDDITNDGSHSFDFSDQTLDILGTQLPENYTVSYYTSFADADAGTNNLSNPYSNVSSPEPIYVRVEANGGAGCYIVDPDPVFNLVVNHKATASALSSIPTCDDDSDGIMTFDLEQQTTVVLGSQIASDFRVTYHETQSDADTNSNPLTSPYSNTTANQQTIFVRVEEIGLEACYETTQFELIVNPLPTTTTMSVLPICDDDTDGLGAFMLTSKDTEALGGQTGVTVSYHETQSDADTNASPLSSPYTNTTPSSQIIFIRLENNTTGCFSTMPLELRVNPIPTANSVSTQTICDDDYDGLATFNFTGIDLTVIGTQTGMVVSYHETQSDADTNTSAVTSPYTSITANAQTLFIRLENTTTGCFDTTTLELLVDPLPVIPSIIDYELCDYTNSGGLQGQFDLSTKDTEIIDGQNVSVAYFETETDATNNTNELTGTYQNTSTPQTLYVALTDLTTGCRATGSFELIVNPLPTTTTMSVLPICDDDTDGLGAFMLTSKDTEALGGQTGVTVSYHETQSDADTNASPLSSPYTNTTPSSQIIFIRLENNTTGCFSTMPLELRVNPIPTANSVSTQTICDDDYDGLATFNFTGIDLTVIGTQTGMVVSYHETQSDADTNTSAVTSPYTSITANAQTLFIRLENSTTGCFDTTTLELLVDPLPVIPSIIDYELCDYTNSGGLQGQFDLSTKDTEIIDGQNVSVAYFETETDATNNTNELTGTYQNTSTPQTLYVALTDLTTGCRATGSFELIVNPLPTTTTMSVLPICDDDTDGLGAFMLTSKDTEALGGQTGVTVSYHETQSDADTNASPLSSPYTNTTPSSQIIFIRLENNTTGCFSTMPLELRVNPIPTANSVSTQTICDDDYDGLATFNFTGIDLTVIGTQTGMVVSYHETQSDADTNTSAVTSPYTSITANAQTLFIRLENTTTGCFDTTTLELLVDPLPVIPSIIDYELCDYTNSGGLQGQFDLSTKDTEIIDGQNVSVAYFETETDATNNTNELTGTYQNTSTPQTLYVALTDLTTGCRATGSFELIVNPLPQLVVPTVLEVCDDGTPDGLTQIDLTEKDDEIKGGNADYSITYYLTQADADSETNPLPIPYTNISNPQTVFARGQDINTGCYTTVALELNVSPAPLAITPQDLTYCDPDSDGFGAFMLTDRDFEISGGVSGVTISYHENLSDAENEINALSSPYTNVDINIQTVFARVENPAVSTLCASIVELVLVVNPTPQLLDPTPLEVCDDDTDEFAQFNLTINEGEFLNGIADSDVDISYYETQADAQAETFEIATPTDYTNLSNPQTVWIRVAYNATGCEKLISLELIVNPLPVLVTPSPLRLCDDNAPGDEQEAFTLEDRETEILNGQTGLDFSYHLTALDAETNSSSLTSPYTNISNPQTIFVRVSNPVTGCFDLTTLTLEVLPIPSPQTPVDMNECDDNATGDGQEVFDLTTNEAFILNGELGVTPTYYETLADAEADTNPIQFPENYTNTDIPVQTIYVRVTNDTTDCFAIINFDVIVDPLPEANPVPTLIACELNTDGIYAFDLEVQSDEIRGTQSATEYDVTYYESLADATLAVNSLTSPYLNTSNPQTIYVNVTNTNTGCQNTAIEFNLEVLEAAQATSPTDPYTICDDNVETDNDPTNDSVLFDLSTQDAFVLNGQDPANYLVRYFASQNDADLDQFELPNFYENTVNPQVIFARVDNNTQIIDNTGTLVDSSVCYETAPLILKVNPLPYIDIDDEYVMCVNTNGTEVLGPLEITTGLSDSDYTFIWRDDSGTIVETASSYVPTEGGIYTLEVSDALLATQCAAPIEVFTVIESEPPTVTAVVTTQAFANTHIIEATATGIGDYEYNIDQGPWQDTGTFVGVNSGERVVNVRDLNGCGVGFAVVYVIDFPKYFTPNGDGYHDTWNIIGISNQLNAKIQIFDRYGKLLKEIRPSGDGWDGTYNGARLPSSDYWFVLSYNEPVTGAPTLLNAHFSLKR